jgi:hypothetical protein
LGARSVAQRGRSYEEARYEVSCAQDEADGPDREKRLSAAIHICSHLLTTSRELVGLAAVPRQTKGYEGTSGVSSDLPLIAHPTAVGRCGDAYTTAGGRHLIQTRVQWPR